LPYPLLDGCVLASREEDEAVREVMREILGSYRVAVETLAIVAVLVVIRAVL
jgi:hypothetical protein